MKKISTTKNWKREIEDLAIQVYSTQWHDVVELTDGVAKHIDPDNGDNFCFLNNLERAHSVKTVFTSTTDGKFILFVYYDGKADEVSKVLLGEFMKKHNIPQMVKSMVK